MAGTKIRAGGGAGGGGCCSLDVLLSLGVLLIAYGLAMHGTLPMPDPLSSNWFAPAAGQQHQSEVYPLPDYYGILGASPTATREQLQRAYNQRHWALLDRYNNNDKHTQQNCRSDSETYSASAAAAAASAAAAGEIQTRKTEDETLVVQHQHSHSEEFMEITRAFLFLSNPEHRASYDRIRLATIARGPDLYALVGLKNNRNATVKEISESFNYLAARDYPAKLHLIPVDSLREQLSYRTMLDAYLRLVDPSIRACYDRLGYVATLDLMPTHPDLINALAEMQEFLNATTRGDSRSALTGAEAAAETPRHTSPPQPQPAWYQVVGSWLFGGGENEQPQQSSPLEAVLPERVFRPARAEPFPLFEHLPQPPSPAAAAPAASPTTTATASARVVEEEQLLQITKPNEIPDFYRILGVHRWSSPKEIKRAHQRLTKLLHLPPPPPPPTHTHTHTHTYHHLSEIERLQLIKEVNAAHAILSDTARFRARYDKSGFMSVKAIWAQYGLSYPWVTYEDHSQGGGAATGTTVSSLAPHEVVSGEKPIIDADTDYYAVLQVPPTATDQEITRSYRKLALKTFHSGRWEAGEYDKAVNNFRIVDTAYEYLTNPELRAEYEQTRAISLAIRKRTEREAEEERQRKARAPPPPAGPPPFVDYYAVLGVEPHATQQQIKKAYRKKCLSYRPEPYRTDEERAAEQLQIKAYSEAYERLSDPKQRIDYDRERVGALIITARRQAMEEQTLTLPPPPPPPQRPEPASAPNPYQILDIPNPSSEATEKDIKKAFRRVSIRYNPDKWASHAEAGRRIFLAIGTAYEILSDPELRALYDQYGWDAAAPLPPPPQPLNPFAQFFGNFGPPPSVDPTDSRTPPPVMPWTNGFHFSFGQPTKPHANGGGGAQEQQ